MTTDQIQKQEQEQVKVRIEGELKHWLKVQAAQNRRTLNREIEMRLEQSRDQQEGAKQP